MRAGIAMQIATIGKDEANRVRHGETNIRRNPTRSGKIMEGGIVVWYGVEHTVGHQLYRTELA